MKKKIQLKKEIHYCDWIVGSAFFLMLVARFVTLFYLSAVASETGADIEAIYTIYEMSPIHKAILNLQQMGIMLSTMIVPSLAVATYLFFRYRAFKGHLQASDLMFYVNFSFLLILTNVFNDLPLLLGKLI